MRKFLIQLALFVSFLVAGLVGIEIVSRRNPSLTTETFVETGDTTKPRTSVRLYHPNLVVDNEITIGDRVVFKARYTTDEYGRRTHSAFQAPRPRHLLWFGCSFLFGVGVNDDETIPYYVNRKAPDYQPFVYAVPAGSMNNMLEAWRVLPMKQQIPPEEGLAVYLLYPELHVQRSAGLPVTLGPGFGTPIYRISADGQGLDRLGSFFERYPVTGGVAHWLMENSHYAQHLAYSWVRPLSTESWEVAARIVNESKREYLQVFPKGRFVVISMDPRSPFNQKLSELGIELFPIENFPEDSPYVIKDDGHYTALGNQTLAEKIEAVLFPKH